MNAILIAYKLRNLDKTIVVSKEDTAFLTDYLFRVENWSYYEILLFANTIDKLGHQTMMLFCRELIHRTQFYREMKQHRLVVSQVLLSAYLVSVQTKELVDAIFLEKTIEGLLSTRQKFLNAFCLNLVRLFMIIKIPELLMLFWR